MALIVRPQNAASAARLMTNALAGAAGMLAGGVYRKAQGKVTDLALNGVKNLINQATSSGGTSKQTAIARTRRRKTAKSDAIDVISQAAPPTALFTSVPRITFGISGRAQRNVEQGDNGVRIIGSDVFPYQIESDGTNSYLPLRSNTGGAHVNVVWLDPAAVSARLSQFMQMYTFYAFRRLKFWYVPVVGTSTGGAISLALSQDLYSNQAADTVTKVLQNQHSSITEVWRPMTLEMVHRGTKVYSPYTSNSVPFGERYQFEIEGCFSSVLAAAVYGLLFVEYEIDFYSPQFTHSGYTLQVKPTTSANSPGPKIESKDESQPRLSSETSSTPTRGADWNDTVTGQFAGNGTGTNYIIPPGIAHFADDTNGSGANTNINGFYTLPVNGTGNNPVIAASSTRSISRPPLNTHGH